MREKITAWFAAHPNARSATRVFVYTFLSVFGLTLFGWIADVQEWANGEDLPFPSISPLAKAAAGALAGAVSAGFSYLWNKLGFTKTAVYVEPPNT